MGRAVVSFTINRRGSVAESRLLASSGSPILEALATIQRAQPFPPLPDRRPKHVFSAPFRFNLRD